MKFKIFACSVGIAAALIGGALGLPANSEPGTEHSHDHMVSEAQDGVSHDEMSHEEMAHGGDHGHKQLEVSADLPTPSIALVVHDDAINGWNLEVQLENFELAPEAVNQSGTQNEGHAHLYVNGEKVTRIYSNWYYLGSLEPGDNEIAVTLNTNAHEDLTVNGEVISASAVISVTE